MKSLGYLMYDINVYFFIHFIILFLNIIGYILILPFNFLKLFTYRKINFIF